MARYFRLWSLSLLAALLAAVTLNYWVDPYGLYRSYRDGEWKPHAATQGALIKPYQVLDARPRTLILGNSRAELGFDPDDTAWPQELRPVYNLALPGSGPRTASRLLDHVLAANSPQMIIVGVDFMDFLVAPDARENDPAIVDRLLAIGDGRPNPWRWLTVLHDGVSTLASLDAVLHSLDTLRVRGGTGVAHLTAAGFSPARDYQVMARQEGYFTLFRQRDVENLRTYKKRHRNLFVGDSDSSPAFDDVAAILRTAHARQIPVKVVIYPYHGHLLEIFWKTDFWALFEEWKRRITSLVTTEGRGNAVLWDFSGYHEYARERVPESTDRSTEVRWYWEAGHFKSTLGHEMLQRIFANDGADFGVILTPESVDSHLQALRLDRESYRLENAKALNAFEAAAAR